MITRARVRAENEMTLTHDGKEYHVEYEVYGIEEYHFESYTNPSHVDYSNIEITITSVTVWDGVEVENDDLNELFEGYIDGEYELSMNGQEC